MDLIKGTELIKPEFTEGEIEIKQTYENLKKRYDNLRFNSNERNEINLMKIENKLEILKQLIHQSFS